MQFWGNPAAWGPAAQVQTAQIQAAGQAAANQFGSVAAFGNALGGLGNNYSDIYKSYAQGLGGAGTNRTGAYNAYASGLGQAANASGFAEAARQASLGNIGTAAMGSYGQAANSALGAWAQNQLAYNQALAGLGQSNQAALSQLGTSRNAALSGLGGAYADLGGRLGAATAIGNMDFGMGGNGFNATGPDGRVASGSYSGGRSSRGVDMEDVGTPSYLGLAALQGNLMAGDITGSLNNNYTDSMNRLDSQHYSSRNMPSQMLGQTLSGLLSLGRDAYGQIRGGMNQFFGSQNAALRNLSDGYRDTTRDLNNYAGKMGDGFGTANANVGGLGSAIRGLFDDSIGQMDMFTSPAQQLRRQREADLFTRDANMRDRVADRQMEEEGFSPGTFVPFRGLDWWDSYRRNMPTF
jgi:hypothetical protein